ncbi:hypothetical protein AO375_0945 [Moraxella catarrhalis]|nr:hypothetical protein AO375_0945 [Moraxella catarrhalis]
MDYKVKVSHSYHIGLKHNKSPSVYFCQSLQMWSLGFGWYYVANVLTICVNQLSSISHTPDSKADKITG